MTWFASLFSSKSSLQGRRKVLSSTQEAFSLPSPVFAQSGLFTRDSSLGTPDPESAATPSFTYPPPSNGTQYGYIPTGTPSRSRPTSLLPLHNAPLSPLPQYPSLEQTWTRIRSWLSTEYPELGDTLNYGILPQDLANIEMQFGFSLPQVIRESYLVVDGQEPESSAGCSDGLFFGLYLLPLDEVLDEWRFWREVDDDPNTGAHPRLREVMQSIPPNWIRKEYSQRGWIPLISDKTGNYVGIDLNPEKGGSVGQVIVFGRDFDTKVVLWRGDGPAGWAHWLASFAEDLESREGFELGLSNESEGSEDDVGYESYFFDGSGRGSGEASGGTTAGAMRLVGEYRGWTTLEAWADKSVRKWQEVGLVSDPPVEEKGKAVEKVGLGVLAAANTTASFGAEVPIPVLADATNSTPSHPNKRQDPDDSLEPPSKAPVPVISITKPPAPLPVDLPTRDDITLGPDSEALHPDDLESGNPLMEVSHLSKSEQSIAIPLTRRAANMSPEDADTSPSTTRTPVDPLSLLDGSVPVLAAPPKKLSSSAGLSPQEVSPPPLITHGNSPMDDDHDEDEDEDDSDDDSDDEGDSDGDESDPEHEESASTVRLVGRDVEVGLSSRPKSDEDDHVLAGIASGGDVEVAGSIG